MHFMSGESEILTFAVLICMQNFGENNNNTDVSQ